MRDPLVSALCPSFRKPKLLGNAIALFERQRYKNCELVILEDSGELDSAAGDGWRIVSLSRRMPSLSEKYNFLADLARGDVFVVWEDDDVFLPDHIANHVAALQSNWDCGASIPFQVLSLHSKGLADAERDPVPFLETKDARMHGSMAMTRARCEAVGGWPESSIVNDGEMFDARLIGNLTGTGVVDTCQFGPPQFVFRWGSTGAYHAQGWMGDDNWYARVGERAPLGGVSEIVPQLDDESRRLLEWATTERTAKAWPIT